MRLFQRVVSFRRSPGEAYLLEIRIRRLPTVIPNMIASLTDGRAYVIENRHFNVRSRDASLGFRARAR